MYIFWQWQKLFKNYYYLHITNEETESKRDEVQFILRLAKDWQNQEEIQVSGTKASALEHEITGSSSQ